MSREAIYFDGFLPPQKHEIRLLRTTRATTDAQLFYQANREGCPAKLLEPIQPPNELFPSTTLGAPGHPRIHNSFVVAEAVECLKSSRYSPITYVVPGEADAYCASAAVTKKSVILTDDSDLFLFDIGESSVALLSTTYASSGPDGATLRCSEFSPLLIAERLGFQPGSQPSNTPGLSRLAYELHKSPGVSLARAIEFSASEPESEQFARFVAPYLTRTDTFQLPRRSSSLSEAPLLDPRVSELVLALMGCSVTPGNTSQTTEARIYLPVLLESHGHGNAFDVGSQIRQIAYSFLGLHSTCHAGCVWEFKRIQPGQRRGSRVELLGRVQLQRAASKLVDRFERIRALEGDRTRFWLYLTLWQEVDLSCTSGKDSVGAALLQRKLPSTIKHEEEGRVPWELVHFEAISKACLYSIRILRQVLENVRMRQGSDDPAVSSLLAQLLELPHLDDFPAMDDILNFFALVRATSAVEAILGGFWVQSESPMRAQETVEASGGSKKRAAPFKAKSGRARGGIYHNPFEALPYDSDA